MVGGLLLIDSSLDSSHMGRGVAVFIRHVQIRPGYAPKFTKVFS